MAPKLGQIVTYMISNADAAAINKRRADALSNMPMHREVADGSIVHVGNQVEASCTAIRTYPE